MKKLAIIGGGAAGLTAAKWAQSGLKNYNITLFEKSSQIGGIWASVNNNSHAWRDMSTNLSRYSCVFSDFPHGNKASLFPTKNEMHLYLSSYTNHFNLNQYIQYNTTIVHADRVDDKWLLTSQKNNKSHEEYFDKLIIANGMFSAPYLPKLNDSETFRGEIIHSAEYKKNTDYSNKDVVIIGGGFSSVEIAVDISKSARSVLHVSHKRSWVIPKLISDKNNIFQPLDLLLYTREGAEQLSIKEKNRKTNQFFAKLTQQNDMPELYIDPNSEEEQSVVISEDYVRLVKEGKITYQQSSIATFEDNGIVLQNNSKISAQIVICCTGYRPNLNFLAPSLLNTLKYDARASLQPITLYESVLHPQLPDLFFIGMGAFRGAYFPIMELQARLAIELFSGRVLSPNEEDIIAYFKKADEVQASHKKPQFINSSYPAIMDHYAKWANLLPPESDKNTWSKLNRATVIPSDYLYSGTGANPAVAERERSRVKDYMRRASCNNYLFFRIPPPPSDTPHSTGNETSPNDILRPL